MYSICKGCVLGSKITKMSKILLLQGAKYSGKHRHKQVITMSFDECRDTYL